MNLSRISHPKRFWKLLNKISTKPTKRDQHGQINISCWVKHFHDLLSTKENITVNHITENGGPLDFEITHGEMSLASSILKTGKTPGFDNITNEMISCILKHFPKLLLTLFNSILRAGCHVPIWSLSLIVPIHKKGSVNEAANYRGISLISCLAKFFYSILNNRLLKFCTERGILNKNQLGFMPGNRTSDAHLILYNLIRNLCHKKGKKCIHVLWILVRLLTDYRVTYYLKN